MSQVPHVNPKSRNIYTWDKVGFCSVRHESDICGNDLFLRPKMEKWYRRAYWNPDEISPQYMQDTTINAPRFRETRFDDCPGYKWASQIEEFEVMAREK